MNKTLTQKIIEAHAGMPPRSESRSEFGGEPALAGAFAQVRIDALLGHDATIALLIDEFERRGLTIWDREKVLFTNDHFSPPATTERADISRRFIEFSRAQKVAHLQLDRGICHQLLVESRLCQPGSLIVGADSHTIMAGALGACATGMGSTDILYALATGATWLRTPESIRITFSGEMPAACSGRDIILELLRLLGEDGARYRAIEFHDHSHPKLSQDERFAVANMAVELGAKFGIFVPDAVTADYLIARDGMEPPRFILPDPGATYVSELELDLSRLTPRIARPYSPANVVPLSELEPGGEPITTAFLGSCSSGRISDIRIAAQELAGKKIHPDVRFIVIPASTAIFRQALQAGYIETLMDAGAIINQPSCGPCGGIDKGVLGARDVCISTSNRNFRGRMGHRDSRTYLASARTVARAALRGAVSADLYLDAQERGAPEIAEIKGGPQRLRAAVFQHPEREMFSDAE